MAENNLARFIQLLLKPFLVQALLFFLDNYGKIYHNGTTENETFSHNNHFLLFNKETLHFNFTGTGVTVNAVHPGLVDTELIRHMGFFNSWLAKIFVKPLIWPFIKTPKHGAQVVIFAALDPDLEKVTGKYFR